MIHVEPQPEPANFDAKVRKNGKILPHPALSPQLQQQVRDMITRLKLDSPGNHDLRVRHFMDYTNKAISSDHFRRYSPFVWMEAQRQGLL